MSIDRRIVPFIHSFIRLLPFRQDVGKFASLHRNRHVKVVAANTHIPDHPLTTLPLRRAIRPLDYDGASASQDA